MAYTLEEFEAEFMGGAAEPAPVAAPPEPTGLPEPDFGMQEPTVIAPSPPPQPVAKSSPPESKAAIPDDGIAAAANAAIEFYTPTRATRRNRLQFDEAPGIDYSQSFDHAMREQIGGFYPTEKTTGADYKNALQSGVWNLGGGMLGLLEYAASAPGENVVSGALDTGRKYMQKKAQANIEELTPEAKYKLAKEFLNSEDSAFFDLQSIGLKLAQTSPSILPSLAAGYGMALKGFSTLATMLTSGAIEGSLAAGDAAAQLAEMVDGMSMADLRKTYPEEVAQLEAAGITGEKEIRSLIKDAAQNIAVPATALTTGIGGAIAGGAIGKTVGKKAAGGTVLPAVGIGKAAGKGALQEGFTEAPQSAFEEFWQNLATNQPALQGTGEAAVAGGVMGSAMGGGMGATFGRRPETYIPGKQEDTDTRTKGIADDAVGAAVKSAIPPPAPAQAPPVATPPPVEVYPESGGGVSQARLEAAQRGEQLPRVPHYGPGYGDITDEETGPPAPPPTGLSPEMQARVAASEAKVASKKRAGQFGTNAAEQRAQLQEARGAQARGQYGTARSREMEQGPPVPQMGLELEGGQMNTAYDPMGDYLANKPGGEEMVADFGKIFANTAIQGSKPKPRAGDRHGAGAREVSGPQALAAEMRPEIVKELASIETRRRDIKEALRSNPTKRKAAKLRSDLYGLIKEQLRLMNDYDKPLAKAMREKVKLLQDEAKAAGIKGNNAEIKSEAMAYVADKVNQAYAAANQGKTGAVYPRSEDYTPTQSRMPQPDMFPEELNAAEAERQFNEELRTLSDIRVKEAGMRKRSEAVAEKERKARGIPKDRAQKEAKIRKRTKKEMTGAPNLSRLGSATPSGEGVFDPAVMAEMGIETEATTAAEFLDMGGSAEDLMMQYEIEAATQGRERIEQKGDAASNTDAKLAERLLKKRKEVKKDRPGVTETLGPKITSKERKLLTKRMRDAGKTQEEIDARLEEINAIRAKRKGVKVKLPTKKELNAIEKKLESEGLVEELPTVGSVTQIQPAKAKAAKAVSKAKSKAKGRKKAKVLPFKKEKASEKANDNLQGRKKSDRPADGESRGGGQGSYETLIRPPQEPRSEVRADEYRNIPDEAQLQGAGWALDKLLSKDKNRTFLLADGTGFGKTIELLMVGNEFANKTGKEVLYVTPSQATLSNLRKEADKLGMSGKDLKITTYATVSQSKPVPKGDYGLIIYDEAHILRNNSATVDRFRQLEQQHSIGTSRMYVTATPGDHINGLGLFATAAEVTTEEFDKQMGIVERRYLDEKGEPEVSRSLMADVSEDEFVKRLAAFNKAIAAKGAILTRQFPHLSSPELVTAPDEDLYEPAAGGYPGGVKLFDNAIMNNPDTDGRTAIQQSSKLAETAKVNSVVKMIFRALADGDKVVVMLGTYKENTKYVETQALTEGGKKARYEIPSAAKIIEAALDKAGVEYVSAYGTGGIIRDMNNFQKKHDGPMVFLTTPQKGGTGIDLDNKPGHRRRTLILTQLPYSALELSQLLGRVDRRSTDKENPPRKWIPTSSIYGDTRRIQIMAAKERNLAAGRAGLEEVAGSIFSEAVTEAGLPYKVTPGRKGTVQVKVDRTLPPGGVRDQIFAILKSAAAEKSKATGAYVIAERRWKTAKDRIDRLLSKGEVLTEARDIDTQKDKADRAVNAYMERAGREKRPVMMKELLQLISTKGSGFTKMLADLALKSNIDVPVVVDILEKHLPEDSGAAYGSLPQDDGSSIGRKIYMRPGWRYPNSTITFLHEVWHALTLHGLTTDNRFAQAMDDTRKWVIKEMGAAEAKKWYGLKDVNEFVSEVKVNAEFRDRLKSIGPTKRNLFARIWHRIANALNTMLGRPTSNVTRFANALERADKLAEKLIMSEEQVQLSDHNKLIVQKTADKNGEVVAKSVSNVLGHIENTMQLSKGLPNWADTNLLLPLLTSRQIVDKAGNAFAGFIDRFGVSIDPIKAYKRLVDAKGAETRRRQTRYFGISREWTRLRKANATMERHTSELMGTATDWAIHPDVPFDHKLNDHLRMEKNKAKDPLPPAEVAENRARHAELEKIWNSLEPDYQKLYRGVRDTYAEDWFETVNHIKANIMRKYNIDKLLSLSSNVGNDMVYAEATKLTNAKDIGEFITRISNMPDFGEGTPEQKQVQAQNIGQALKDVLRASKVEGPYFPMRRFGKWVVRTYGKKNTVTGADKAKLNNKRTEMLRELRYESYKFSGVQENEDGTYGFTYQELSVEYYEQKGQADKRLAELEEQYAGTDTKVAPIALRQHVSEKDRVSNTIFTSVESKLANEPRLQNAWRTAVIESMPDTSLNKAKLRRQGIKGYSNDQQRALAQHAMSSSNYLSQLRYGHQLGEMMQAIRERANDTFEGTTQMQRVYNEFKKRDDLNASSNTHNAVAEGAANYSFFHYLGSPSYWFINMTQPHMITTPWLAARYTWGKATREMNRAYKALHSPVFNTMGMSLNKMKSFKDIPPEFFDFLITGADGKVTIMDSMRDAVAKGRFVEGEADNELRSREITSMLEWAAELGIIEMTFAADTKSIAKGGTEGPIARMMDYTRIMPHLVEVMNRTVSATAAYNLARNEGKGVAEAREFAEAAVANTQFDYSAENKPRWFNPKQFAYAKPVFMFMQHSQHMYVMMVQALIQGIGVPTYRKFISKQPLTPEEMERVRIARRTFANITGTHMLMAGFLGGMFEPIKWAIGLAAFAFGDDDEPYEPEAAWRRGTKNVIQDALGVDKETAAYMERLFNQGVLPGLFGVDLQSRMGLNRMLYWEEPASVEGKDWMRSMLAGVAGPMWGIGENWADAGQYLAKGDTFGAIDKVMPKGFRDMFRAAGMARQGMLDYNGNTIAPASQMNPWDVFATAMGVNISKRSESMQERMAISNATRFYDDRRRELLQRYFREDRVGKRKLWLKEIVPFNRAVPAPGLKITQESIAKSREKRKEIESGYRKYGSSATRTRRGLQEKYGGVGDV